MIIYKYEIPLQSEYQLDISAKSELLDIQIQNGKIMAWVKMLSGKSCNVDITLKFYIVGTGIEFDHSPQIKHFRTIQLDGFVWHIFIDWDYKKEAKE